MATDVVAPAVKITRKDITKAASAVKRLRKNWETAQEQADYWNGRVVELDVAHTKAAEHLQRLMDRFTRGE